MNPIRITVLNSLSGDNVAVLQAPAQATVRELKQLISQEMKSRGGKAQRQQLKLFAGETELHDVSSLQDALGDVLEVVLTLFLQAQYSVSGNFADFHQNWQIVATATDDPHGTYLYDPRKQEVEVKQDGTGVSLRCRGRIATREEVMIPDQQGAVRINGKFTHTASSEDFLTVLYGVRPLHTGLKPYGSMDDAEDSVCIHFWGGVFIEVGKQHTKLADFDCRPNQEYSFSIRLDAVAGCISVQLSSSDGVLAEGSLHADLKTLTFPGHHVALLNREFSGCETQLRDVDISVLAE